MSQKAWVTLATNDGYAVGALVLAHSLRNVQTQHKLHILYTNGVSPQIRFNESIYTQKVFNSQLSENNYRLHSTTVAKLTFWIVTMRRIWL